MTLETLRVVGISSVNRMTTNSSSSTSSLCFDNPESQAKLDHENLKSITSGSRPLQSRLVPEAEGVADVLETRLLEDVA